MRQRANTDNNQSEIVQALRSIGCFVLHTHQLKNAFDILVCYRGKVFIMEIKNPDKLPKNYDRKRLGKQLSKGERQCMEQIQATNVIYHIVTTSEQAIQIVTE